MFLLMKPDHPSAHPLFITLLILEREHFFIILNFKVSMAKCWKMCELLQWKCLSDCRKNTYIPGWARNVHQAESMVQVGGWGPIVWFDPIYKYIVPLSSLLKKHTVLLFVSPHQISPRLFPFFTVACGDFCVFYFYFLPL